MTRSQFINDANNCVHEALEGLCMLHPGVKKVEGHNIIVRADSNTKSGRVALVSGGGSGHEPTHAGYVGQGMLTAAVCGHVFTSPNPRAVHEAIAQVSKNNNGAGVILVVNNYTGDRLNFGLAAERARLDGVNVAMITVAEDAAVESLNRTAGRRGLAGCALVLKIAGGMSEQGESLDAIVSTLTRIVAPENLTTVGLSLSPCHLPGSTSASFSIPPGQAELGLGIHGEAGHSRITMTTAADVVDQMVNTMMGLKDGVRLGKGQKIVLLINNLGGCSGIEMQIAAREAILCLEKKFEVLVERVFCGSFVTSLEMAGISLTVLRIEDEKWIHFLDFPTSALGWPNQNVVSTSTQGIARHQFASTHLPSLLPPLDLQRTVSNDVSIGETSGQMINTAVRAMCRAVVACEEAVNEMDRIAGDGDCGSAHRRGAEEILRLLDRGELDLLHPINLFNRLSSGLEVSMGGSSGAIWALFLSAVAAHLSSTKSLSFLEAFRAGVLSVSTIGGAHSGDRTLLDALIPALDAWEKNTQLDMSHILKLMATAADAGAESTATMEPGAGRASYMNPDRILEAKSRDPGAHITAIILQAASNALNQP